MRYFSYALRVVQNGGVLKYLINYDSRYANNNRWVKKLITLRVRKTYEKNHFSTHG